MQVEMRKREQELLSKIKEQQKELDAVKAEKTKVERELTRAEREREEERRELERQRMELESRKSQESEVERRESYRRPYERVLNREKASPAHLRGRRPPSLVSSENDEEVEELCKEQEPAVRRVPISIIKSDDSVVKPPTHSSPARCDRRPSLRKTPGRESSVALNRSNSLRAQRDNKPQSVGRTAQSPSVHRREVKSKEKLPLRPTRTPSFRRKAESQSSSKETKDCGHKTVGLVRFCVYVSAPMLYRKYSVNESTLTLTVSVGLCPLGTLPWYVEISGNLSWLVAARTNCELSRQISWKY